MRKLAIFSILLFGLSTQAFADPQERAVIAGAATGAVIGAAIASSSGHPLQGAVVGAAIGTVAGAIVGDLHQEPQTTTVVKREQARADAHSIAYGRRSVVKVSDDEGRKAVRQVYKRHGNESRSYRVARVSS